MFYLEGCMFDVFADAFILIVILLNSASLILIGQLL